MICRTCLRRAAALNIRPQTTSVAAQLPRAFSVSASTRSGASLTQASPSSATAQPSSTPTPTPTLTTPIDPSAAAKSTGREPSSCPGGTVLSGLNYFKGKTDPIALPDEEYPDWLWECLEFKASSTDEADANAGDEFSKSRKQRRLAAKRKAAIEAKLLAEGNVEALAPKIPLQQQSINLPGSEKGDVADNLFASGKREELRQAMRSERKAKIKEANYLKSM